MTDDHKPTAGDKIKKHFRDHKTTYLVAGTAVVAAVISGLATALAMEINKKENDTFDDSIDIGPSISNNIGVAINSPISNVLYNVAMIDRSTPSNEVENEDGTRRWNSQNELARDLGVTAGAVANHLHGRTETLKGEKFHKVPKVTPEDIGLAA